MDRIRKSIAVTSIFSVAVITALVYFSDPSKFLQVIKNGDPAFLLSGTVFLNLPLFIYAFTWFKIFEATGIYLSYLDTLRVLLANTFINNITPFGNIGGEAAATYFISRVSEHSPGKIFSAVFISGLINFFPLLSLLLIGLGLNFYIGILSVLLAGLTIFTAFLYYSIRSESFGKHFLLEKMSGRVKGFFEEFESSLKGLDVSSKSLIVLFSGSHLASILDVTGIILVGFSFGVDLFHPLILLCVPLGRLANYFPTPGGTGSYETAFTGLLVFFFGLSVAEGLSISLTYRFLTYYFGLIVGYASAVSLGLSPEIFDFEGEGIK